MSGLFLCFLSRPDLFLWGLCSFLFRETNILDRVAGLDVGNPVNPSPPSSQCMSCYMRGFSLIVFFVKPAPAIHVFRKANSIVLLCYCVASSYTQYTA